MINYIKYFRNTTGGLENFSDDLLRKLQLLNTDLVVYKPSLNNRLLNYIIYYFKLIFKSDNVTLVHYGNFFDLFFIWFLSFINRRIIVICHVGKSWRHIRINYLNRITNFLVKSKKIKLLVIAEAQRKFIKKKSIKIPTIINENFFSTKIKHNLSKHILFIGRVSEDKGVFNLLTAYNQLIKKIKLPKLLIVGPFENNNYQKKCENFCFKNNLNSSVSFKGPIYDINKKIKLIDESFFGIYPSLYDAFPLTLLEFYSRKKILLCSNISESVNFVTNEMLLVNPHSIDDIINKLANLIKMSKEEYNKNVIPMYEKTKKYDGNILAQKIKKITNDKF